MPYLLPKIFVISYILLTVTCLLGVCTIKYDNIQKVLEICIVIVGSIFLFSAISLNLY